MPVSVWCTTCTIKWLSCTRAKYQWKLLSLVLLFFLHYVLWSIFNRISNYGGALWSQ